MEITNKIRNEEGEWLLTLSCGHAEECEQEVWDSFQIGQDVEFCLQCQTGNRPIEEEEVMEDKKEPTAAELQAQLAKTLEMVEMLSKQVAALTAPKATGLISLPIEAPVEKNGLMVLPKETLVPVAPKASRKGLPREGRHYDILKVPSIEDATPQAVKCMLLLEAYCKQNDRFTITEAEAMEVLNLEAHARYIGRKQTGWEVFSFYKIPLTEMGCIRQFDKFEL